MAKINEYPQAATINNNDLFVIDQQSGGDHATKSASVSQIADKATSGVQTQIGSLSQLTTTDKSSLVGAVNEIDKSLDFQTAKSVKFQVASGRLLIYLYTDDLKQNGMRIDFDSSANVIELSSITNGTTTPTNRITFNHV